MKKSLFFVAAASALMLTACSSENDVVQNAPQTQETVAQAVGFDVYMSDAVTRAGYAGVMTTEKMKINNLDDQVGFGVMTYYHEGADYAAGITPNFMYNEHVTWAGGWTYSPLKYWPNETTKDSQTTPIDPAQSAQTDMLSFFAYAPYVTTGATPLGTKDNTTMDIGGGTKIYAYHGSEASGITAISAENYDSDPKVEWKVSANPDNNVDLLWGVAPEGFSYTAVNGSSIKKIAGLPLTNLVKPDKDQKIKFLFEHALSRIGLTVVSAIDQVADGGVLDANTKVLIENVKIYGDFGTEGVLNLNNSKAHEANWIEASVNRTASTSVSPLFTIDGTTGYLAPSLRYVTSQISAVASNVDDFSAVNAGVLTSEQPLMVGGPDPSTKVGTAASTPDFEWDQTYYYLSGVDYVLANISHTNSADLYTYDATEDKYTQAYTTSNTSITLDGNSAKLYEIVGSALTTSDELNSSKQYYKKTVVGGKNVFTVMNGTDSNADANDTYYLKEDGFSTLTSVTEKYASQQYWTDILPRYFMVIPSKVSPATATTINVQITYHVVTKDAKLTGHVSNVTNTITKTIPITLVNGKSYNLKLILGLTSVKLDATVKDWQVADETEVYLPRNND